MQVKDILLENREVFVAVITAVLVLLVEHISRHFFSWGGEWMRDALGGSRWRSPSRHRETLIARHCWLRLIGFYSRNLRSLRLSAAYVPLRLAAFGVEEASIRTWDNVLVIIDPAKRC